MRRRLALLAPLLLVALAHAEPPTAKVLMDGARTKAKREGKNVLVVFHASWCGWCKRFDKMLDDPKLKPIIERDYVVVHLDVLEHDDKKELENPGGMPVLASLGGMNAGLPFFAVVAPDNTKLADSNRKDNGKLMNTGYPASPAEIAHFVAILKKTAPKMTEADRTAVEAYLKADAARS